MIISPIPAFNDNYIWVITEQAQQYAVVVDPGDANPVLEFLQTQKLHLAAIIVTHHHLDHSGGVKELIKATGAPVWAGKNSKLKEADHKVGTGDIVKVPEINLNLTTLEVPGHTLDHIALYDRQNLFTGDTLFNGGCGRVFEGTFPMMYNSLQSLAALPQHLNVYSGHEYTLNNLKFAVTLEPHNQDLTKRLALVQQLRAQNKVTIPATLEMELKTNPFLRTHQPTLINIAEKFLGRAPKADWEVFQVIREMKDRG